jgi:hypothetical protein
MNKKEKIIFLNNYPMDKRDFQRFGVETITRRGIEVEIWDVSKFYYQNLEKIKINTPFMPTVTNVKIQSLFHLHKCIQELNKNDIILVAGTTAKINSFTGFGIFRLISNSNLFLGHFTWGDHPIHQYELNAGQNIKSHITKIKNRISLILNPNQLKAAAITKAINSTFFIFLNSKVGLIRPFSQVWFGVLDKRTHSIFISDKTEIRFVHNLDYDNYLKYVSTTPINSKQIVFLDSMGPLHPDFVIIGRKSDIDIESYRKIVKKSFEIIERSTGCEIVIAAHPRSNEIISKKLYGNRKTFFDKTAELVSKCRAVAVFDGSTSISYAVLWAKPIILLYSSKNDRESRLFNDIFIKELNPNVLDIDSTKSFIYSSEINERKYTQYKANYIKKNGTPDKIFWDVVLDDLKLP